MLHPPHLSVHALLFCQLLMASSVAPFTVIPHITASKPKVSLSQSMLAITLRYLFSLKRPIISQFSDCPFPFVLFCIGQNVAV